MQNNGIRADQITEVRGFADQRLRKTDAPLDPSNRRISLIVQYMEKPSVDVAASPGKERGSEGAKAPEGKAAGPPAGNEAQPATGEADGTAPQKSPEKK
jgi:chemotaxis protein MotB